MNNIIQHLCKRIDTVGNKLTWESLLIPESLELTQSFDLTDQIEADLVKLTRQKAQTFAEVGLKLNTLIECQFLTCSVEEYSLIQAFLKAMGNRDYEPIRQSYETVFKIIENEIDEEMSQALFDSCKNDFECILHKQA